MANQKAFEDLKAAKNKELDAGKQQVTAKTDVLSDVDVKLAQATEDLEDTKDTLAADEEFLLMLKDKCSLTDQEWEERQKARQLEMQAVSKALAVLSSDNARHTFMRTFSSAFFQQQSVACSKHRDEAAGVLVRIADKVRSPQLADLAMKVRLDTFARVKQAITDMIEQLIKQQEDEVKHRDFCIDEFNTNERQTDKKVRKKTKLASKVEDIELTIKELSTAIDSLKGDVAEMQVQMKRAGEDREKENKEFQNTISDQRSTQKLLTAALSILKGVYEKPSLLQKQEPAGPPPPPGLKGYQKSNASGGILGMIQQIIDDAKIMEAAALKAEERGQKSYEEFIKETNLSIEAMSKDIINKAEANSAAEADLIEARESKAELIGELEHLSSYNAELHQSCDFVMKNFELRQTARDEEVEGLRQAKAILEGASFTEFLQSPDSS